MSDKIKSVPCYGSHGIEYYDMPFNNEKGTDDTDVNKALDKIPGLARDTDRDSQYFWDAGKWKRTSAELPVSLNPRSRDPVLIGLHTSHGVLISTYILLDAGTFPGGTLFSVALHRTGDALNTGGLWTRVKRFLRGVV